MRDERPNYLLYDGECDFCQQWADWVRARDTNTHRFHIMPWQDAPSPPMTPLLRVQSQRAVQLITNDGRHLQGGHAALATLRETGWHPEFIELLEHRPAVWLVDLAYKIVAANRSHVSWLAPR